MRVLEDDGCNGMLLRGGLCLESIVCIIKGIKIAYAARNNPEGLTARFEEKKPYKKKAIKVIG
jgi:hypothetical protein